MEVFRENTKTFLNIVLSRSGRSFNKIIFFNFFFFKKYITHKMSYGAIYIVT